MTKVEKFLLEKEISRKDFEKGLSLLVECLHDGSQKLEIEVGRDPVEYPPGFFKPEKDEVYFWVDTNDGEAEKTENNNGVVDENLILFGNCYQTKDQAQAALDQKKAYVDLVRLIAELNHREGWVCDWDDHEQIKGRLSYYHTAKPCVNKLTTTYIQFAKTELYFKHTLTDELISTLTPEKIKLALWGIR